MLPNYTCGDYVLTYRWPLCRLNAGDVVVVKHQNFGIIVKRIASIEANKNLTLVGDNAIISTASEILGSINPGQVIGKVLFRIAAP